MFLTVSPRIFHLSHLHHLCESNTKVPKFDGNNTCLTRALLSQRGGMGGRQECGKTRRTRHIVSWARGQLEDRYPLRDAWGHTAGTWMSFGLECVSHADRETFTKMAQMTSRNVNRRPLPPNRIAHRGPPRPPRTGGAQ